MIFVTGGTGFLGSVLVRQLLDAGEPVRILRRETSSLDLLGDAAERVEHAVGDVTDPDAMREAMRGASVVYHTAAFVGFGGKRDAEQLHAVNVLGTAHVVDAALAEGVSRFVHTSSMAAFGRPERPPAVIDESAEWTPSPMNTAYAESKHASELEVQRGVAEGLDAVIVNPAVIFGPGRSGENTTAIVERARRGARFAPAGGTNVVDVEDVAAGMRAAMSRGASGERYFLGSENLRWIEILGTLAQAFGQPRPSMVVPPLAAQVAGAVLEVGARLVGRRPVLTRETARLSGMFYRYSNHKARAELDGTFRPFAATAERIAAEAE